MPAGVKILSAVIAALLLVAVQAIMIWMTAKFFLPQYAPEVPPEKIIAARNREILRRVLLMLAYVALPMAVLEGPRTQAISFICALLLLLLSMVIRPKYPAFTEERMKELSRQERAAHLARRLAKAAEPKR